MPQDNPALEKCYRVSQIASMLSIGRETSRKIVMNEPGVLKIRFGRKMAHTTYLVPESVLQRIITRLKNVA